MRGEQESLFRRVQAERAHSIKEDAFVDGEWLRFCEERRHSYLSSLLGHNRILRALNAGGLLERWLYGKRRLLGARNVVCCETHREALETIFNHGLI